MDLETLCCGCLSSDRRLYQIKDLTLLEAEIQFVQLNNVLKYVCWECKAILIKMNTFREKVARAELLLKNYCISYDNKAGRSRTDDLSGFLKTLSSLVTNPNEVIKTPTVRIKTEIISEENIKTEMCDSVPIEYDEHDTAEIQDCNENNIQPESNVSQAINAEDIFNDIVTNEDNIEIKHNYNEKDIYNDSGTEEEELTDNDDEVENIKVKYVVDNVNKKYLIKTLTFDEVMAKRKAKMTSRMNFKYKCDICLIYFKSDGQYKKHQKYHLEENKYRCTSCPMTFPSEAQLTKHRTDEHIQYECNMCPFVGDTVNNITLHIDALHRDGDFTIYENVLRNLSFSKPVSCNVCHKVLESEWQLHAHRELTHTATHASPALDDYCVNCKIKFKSSLGYKIHIRSNKYCANYAKSSQCNGNYQKPQIEKCLEEIYSINKLSEDELHKHRQEMKDAPDSFKFKFVCGLCVAGFKTRKLLNDHLTLHSADGQKCSALCRVCLMYCDVTQMTTHVYDHYKMYGCNLCQFSSKDFPTIQDHYKKKHVYFTDDNVNEYTCKYCPSIPVFRNRKNYMYHMDTRHSETNICTICGKIYKTKFSLNNHIKFVHKNEPPPKSECTICHKMYHSKNLKQHMQVTHTELAVKPYCIECNIYFKNEHSYAAHLKYKHASSDEKKYECSVCSKLFRSLTMLKSHKNLIHLRKRECQCDMCNKKFLHKSSLKIHINSVHNKIKMKKKKCTICAKMVLNMKEHMYTHTGERPYKCGICEDTFSFNSALYMHNRLVHLKLKKNGKPKKTADSLEEIM